MEAHAICRLAGAILAGGRSRRMGGGFKALAPLGGKPLIRQVIDRLQPQVQSLVLSVEKHVLDFEAARLLDRETASI